MAKDPIQAEIDRLNQEEADVVSRELDRLNTIEEAQSVPQGSAAGAPKPTAKARALADLSTDAPAFTPSKEDPAGVGAPTEAEKLTVDPNKASIPETIALHGAQGLTGRLSDEIFAGQAASDFAVDPDMAKSGGPVDIGPAQTPQERKKIYVGVRDLIRERQTATGAANPITAGLSEIGGGALLPIPGGAARPKGLPFGPMTAGQAAKAEIAHAGKVGAGIGAVAGVGGQDSGRGKIATPGELLESGVVGAAIGGPLGMVIQSGGELVKRIGTGVKDLVGKYTGSAPERVDNRILKTATGANEKGGAAKSVKDPLADNQDIALDIIKSEGVNVDSPAHQIAGARQAATKADAAANAAMDAGPKVDANDVVANLRKIQASQNKPANIQAVQRQIDTVQNRYLPEKPLSDKDLLNQLSDGAKGKLREKIGTEDTQFVETAKKFGLDKSVRDPDPKQHVAVTKSARDKSGNAISNLYDEVQNTHGQTTPFTLDKPVQELVKLRDGYLSNPATKKHGQVVDALITDMSEVWGQTPPTPDGRVPVRLQDFRKMVTEIQNSGFGGSYLDPSAAQAIQRDLAKVSKKTLDDYLDSVGEGKRVAELNREYTTLTTLHKAARQRAAREALKPETAGPVTPAGPRDGKISLRELDNMANEIKPRPPSIQSQREAVRVRPKLMPSERIAEGLRELINEQSPEVASHLKRREVADLLVNAGITRGRAQKYAPDLLEKLAKGNKLDVDKALGAIPGAVNVAYGAQKYLDKKLAASATKPKTSGGVGQKVKELSSRVRTGVTEYAAGNTKRKKKR